MLPEQPEANVFTNDTDKTISKKQKSDGPCIEVAPGEDRDLSDWIRQHNFDVDSEVDYVATVYERVRVNDSMPESHA